MTEGYVACIHVIEHITVRFPEAKIHVADFLVDLSNRLHFLFLKIEISYMLECSKFSLPRSIWLRE